MSEPILKLEGLKKHFNTTTGGAFNKKKAVLKAVDGIDLEVNPGETIGLVGESGCGKTTAGRTILKLYEPTDGKIIFNGEDITNYSRAKMKPLRREMQMIFQDPFASLNPRQTVGTIIANMFEIQGITPPGGVENEVRALMERVGLNPEHLNRYPHEFSGGQRQRIGVARAIALKPKLIVADEPVSALDVSIQAQVVNLLEDLQDEFNLSYIFVAHDLSVVQHISDRVIVMYLGKVMEEATKVDLFANPRHPYTKALLSAVPTPDPVQGRKRERIMLQGDLPSPINPPAGCVFNTRCWKATEKCRTEVPLLQIGKNNHKVACHFPEN
ncbi:MAG: dipeptide ABC transporter ATP-binding protein [Candidatus Nanopelagicaceae bacterium]|jgi:oligopeptide/dipeptide ABC transporter ATP-binding protein|nr:dipeptide ABC transporter ATP-binding protein [Candidatus Nanopelagicaceae bacterium]